MSLLILGVSVRLGLLDTRFGHKVSSQRPLHSQHVHLAVDRNKGLGLVLLLKVVLAMLLPNTHTHTHNLLTALLAVRTAFLVSLTGPTCKPSRKHIIVNELHRFWRYHVQRSTTDLAVRRWEGGRPPCAKPTSTPWATVLLPQI